MINIITFLTMLKVTKFFQTQFSHKITSAAQVTFAQLAGTRELILSLSTNMCLLDNYYVSILF